MLVSATLGAPTRRRRARRIRLRATERRPDPEPVALTRLTVVTPEQLGDARGAGAWLERLARDPEAAEGFVADAVRLANRALHAHATAAQDPYTCEVSAERAVAIRVGFGAGEQVADGSWEDARELERREPRRRRSEALQPQERVAAVLGEHEVVAPCETLLLRARADLDQGRAREAALQLRAGLASLVAELGAREDVTELRDRQPELARIADRALREDVDPDRVALLADTLARCERVLRRSRMGLDDKT